MFRIKKGSESDSQPTIAAQRQEPVDEAQVAKPPPPRRTLPTLPRPADGPNFAEITRRNNVPAASTRADAGASRDKSLVVGKEVRLKGEISFCDKMMLEGAAEITLTDTRQLQIGASGYLRGSADVAEADVAGHFEGDLVARERLTVRPTGRLRGNIRYAQITIEAGGQITGEMTTLDTPVTAEREATVQPTGATLSGEAAVPDRP